jgi:hypothetical protein
MRNHQAGEEKSKEYVGQDRKMQGKREQRQEKGNDQP